jgi:hypothetical protein
MIDDGPVIRFRDAYEPEKYWSEEYVKGAEPILAEWGWLTRPLNEHDTEIAEKVLGYLDDLSLDEDDVSPFGLLWALRSTGAIGYVPSLDNQLVDWRVWEEVDHLSWMYDEEGSLEEWRAEWLAQHGSPLGFLPGFPIREDG